jgi:hypothetical protein
MDNRRRLDKQLTNKELIRVRKRVAVRDLAIASEHSRAHSPTGAHRKLTKMGQGRPDGFTDEDLKEHAKREAEHSRRIRNLINMSPSGVPCVASKEKPQERRKAEPSPAESPPLTPLQERLREELTPAEWAAKPWPEGDDI